MDGSPHGATAANNTASALANADEGGGSLADGSMAVASEPRGPTWVQASSSWVRDKASKLAAPARPKKYSHSRMDA